MAQYLMSVHHPDGYPDLTPEEMQPVFEAVGACADRSAWWPCWGRQAWPWAGGWGASAERPRLRRLV